jgi:glycosyl hydrolase family 42 (putative beta-galactosidase)
MRRKSSQGETKMILSRRDLLSWTAAGSAALAWLSLGGIPSLAASGPTRWQIRADKKRQLAGGIRWLTHEPLEFLLRRGDHGDDEPEHYARMVEPANIARMAAAGVKWGRIFFYKGFGLHYERPHIDIAKRVADQMHDLGMKVSLYIGGTMFTETLYREIPEAVNWEQRDQWNQPVTYGDQTFRHFACPNEPAYRDYIKRVIKVAISELRADELAFDNPVLQPEPHACRCPRCAKAFIEFLRARYSTPEAVHRRFGLPDVESVSVAQWETPDQPAALTALNDPVLQEWTRFRCQSLANYTGDLYDHARGLSPGVAVLLNIKGIYSYNRCWTNAVYHPLFAGRIDIMAFDTGGYDEHIDAGTGALISQIRSYKTARQLGCNCEDAMEDDVRASVHMAFGVQKPLAGNIATPFGSEAHNVFTPLLEFFREYNDEFYTQTQNVADVAVLRNWPSMAFSINATSIPATLMEQVLIQYRIPFDLLFDEQLTDLSRYGAIILAGQECVSDAQANLLLDYAQNGGSLIVTGNTGQFNEWRESRHANPFQPARAVGKGRIVFIPEIVRADRRGDPPAHEQMAPPQWVLPRNHAAISRTIIAALPGGLSIRSDAPLTTVMELVSRPSSRQTIAHFVNFDRANQLAPFKVWAKQPLADPLQSVSYYSPDADDPADLSFEKSGGWVTFTVPATRVYAMVVMKY